MYHWCHLFQIMDELYMGDLQKALLQSKVDFEAAESDKQTDSVSPAAATAPKSNKPVSLSLEEFHALNEKKPVLDAPPLHEPRRAVKDFYILFSLYLFDSA